MKWSHLRRREGTEEQVSGDRVKETQNWKGLHFDKNRHSILHPPFPLSSS